MARETKVGLLTGLAFIICFAIILANRGRQEPGTTHWPYLVDGGANVQRAARDLAFQPSSTHPPSTPAGQTAAAPQQTTQPAVSSNPVRTDRDGSARQTGGGPGSGAEAPLPARVGNSSMPSRPSQVAGRPGARARTPASTLDRADVEGPGAGEPTHTAGVDTPASSSRAPAGNLTSRSAANQAERRQTLDQLLNARTTQAAQQAQATGSIRLHPAQAAVASSERAPDPASKRTRAPMSKPASRAARPTRYTVKPGDTLSGIAAAHYATRSPTVINAVFDANRSRLSSPDVLSVGVELALPVVEGFNSPSGARSQAAPSAPPPRPQHTERAEPSRPSFRWYQIKKNDRYISIAREQLGDANRWREIYEMNQDKFPNAQMIRDGVRIKLPVSLEAMTGARP